MSLEAIMAQYKGNTETNGNYTPKKVDLSNYFSTYLEKGVNEATKVIRILPSGETPFTKIYIHPKKIDNQYRKLVCVKEMYNEDCPFCEAFDGLMAKDTDDHRKAAYKLYKPREVYVVKVIDRSKEGEGVKFWRFNHSRQKDGIYDQIINNMIAAEEDFSDPNSGRDITIKISRNQAGIPVVSSIITAFKQSPLSTDEALAKLWLEDERSWSDVYAKKEYDYLRIVVEDGDPVWDKEKKTYVNRATQNSEENYSGGQDDGADLDNELVMGSNSQTTQTPKVEEPKAETPKVEAQPSTPPVEEEEEDDLPF